MLQEHTPDKDQKSKYPFFVTLILFSEFSEKFCYTGYYIILKLFFYEELNYNSETRYSLIRTFERVSIFTPLLGGIIADIWLGCFKTISYAFILYILGNTIVIVSSIPKDVTLMRTLALLGVLIAVVGNGGMQPCLPAFGGDQFKNNQTRQRRYFFSLFYLVSNVGTILPFLFLTDLRAEFKCFYQDTYSALTFGIPSLLVLLSFIVFICGKPWYERRTTARRTLASFFKCVAYALIKKVTNKGEKRDHWLDHADNKYDEDLIIDIKSFLNILWLYLPLPLFWALHEKQGTKWMLQAVSMDNEIRGFGIKRDYMQTINPVMIVILIPVFECIVYPCMSKLNLCKTDLQRMTVGGCLFAVAFLISGVTEMNIAARQNIPPYLNKSDLFVVNNSPCKISVKDASPKSLEKFDGKFINISETADGKLKIVPEECSASGDTVTTISSLKTFTIVMLTLWDDELYYIPQEGETNGTSNNITRVKIYFKTEKTYNSSKDIHFILESGKEPICLYPSENISLPFQVGWTDYHSIDPDEYTIYFSTNETDSNKQRKERIDSYTFLKGASYVAAFYQTVGAEKDKFSIYTIIPNIKTPLFYLLPQIFILTCGEVMFCVTGLIFSYSQAPKSLKAMVQATWLLSNAIGNTLVIFIEKFPKFENQSSQHFLYAVLMLTSMLAFACLGHLYKYVNEDEISG
ncbi:hypothetical protein NPIL_528771 [Nephila pilipes]|uniref:Uncharacterized protein n=1 Tax=Nephila pilipes TaxID=299642 RepID=A0A8X6N8P3_NEPPI|nr:hypothetical protein NPIL_528771 [Nephila pilipes]